MKRWNDWMALLFMASLAYQCDQTTAPMRDGYHQTPEPSRVAEAPPGETPARSIQPGTPPTPTRSPSTPTPTIPPQTRFITLKDKPIAQIDDNHLDELSGITPASIDNEFWGHNDKGNGADLFRFDTRGKVRQTVKLENGENEDWEAISRGPRGALYIGGFGDNDRNREECVIIKLNEPGADVKKTKAYTRYRFEYSDGLAHNCEAMAWIGGKIFLFIKEENVYAPPSPIFVLDGLREDRMNVARARGALDARGTVTDAFYDARTHTLAILTYSHIALFHVERESDLHMPPRTIAKADLGQCEGLCIKDGDLYVSNENGDLWKWRLADLQ